MRFDAPRLPSVAQDARLLRDLYDNFRRIAAHLDGISRGRIDAHDEYTSAPTTGSWKQGDFVRNSSPSEAGTAGSKYVITGWVCVASGEPGTWVETRSLTGN